MSMIEFIVLDAAGAPVRSGWCQAQDFDAQARDGETVRKPTKALRDRLARQRKAMRTRVAAFRAAAAAEPSRSEVLGEALLSKGLIAPTDLEAARLRLRQ